MAADKARGGRPKDSIWDKDATNLKIKRADPDRFKCNRCGEEFSGGASRAKEHLGMLQVEKRGIKICPFAHEAVGENSRKRRRLEIGSSSAPLNANARDIESNQPSLGESNLNFQPPAKANLRASLPLESQEGFTDEVQPEGPSNVQAFINDSITMPSQSFNTDCAEQLREILESTPSINALSQASHDAGQIATLHSHDARQEEVPLNVHNGSSNIQVFDTMQTDQRRDLHDPIPPGMQSLHESRVSSLIRGLQDTSSALPHTLIEENQANLVQEETCNEAEDSIASVGPQRSTRTAVTARDTVSKIVIESERELVGQAHRRTVDEIWDRLVKDNVTCLGVFGMGGVGKTLTLENLNNRACRSTTFNAVFWVTVSKDCTLQQLQKKIAKASGAPDLFKGKDDRLWPTLLINHLKDKSKSLIILDDMWESFELRKVGIPVAEHGIHIVLTTRYEDVCKKIQCKEILKVEPLSDEEAWELFAKTLGSDLPPHRKPVAKSIVEECKGLPLAIIVTAGGLRAANEDYVWEDTLEKLKNPEDPHQDMRDGVFPILQVSYDRLDMKKQQCLLQCALYPEDRSINRRELIERYIDEEVIRGDSRKKIYNSWGKKLQN